MVQKEPQNRGRFDKDLKEPSKKDIPKNKKKEPLFLKKREASQKSLSQQKRKGKAKEKE
jgi:hypothetical protein